MPADLRVSPPRSGRRPGARVCARRGPHWYGGPSCSRSSAPTSERAPASLRSTPPFSARRTARTCCGRVSTRQRLAIPSVTPALPAAHWDERELADLLGVVPEGHPDPRPLVRRPDWPRDVYPLRKDFDPARCRPRHAHWKASSRVPVEGEGVVEVPVGPIHAGIIEPGHFRFAAIGELVLQLEARLFYTHRGIEKLAEGRTPEQALPLAERVCGACAFSHAVAFCEAVESLARTPSAAASPVGAHHPARVGAAVQPPRRRWQHLRRHRLRGRHDARRACSRRGSSN